MTTTKLAGTLEAVAELVGNYYLERPALKAIDTPLDVCG